MKAEAENEFKETTNELILLLDSFTPSEINKVPFPGSWTAGQVGDHLYRSYWVINTLQGSVEPTERPVDQKIPEVKELFLDMNIKMTSPEAILPTNEEISKEQLLKGLRERVSIFQEIIGSEDLSLICRDYAIPEYGPFTRLEWVYFTIFHTRRHNHQIKQIREIVRV